MADAATIAGETDEADVQRGFRDYEHGVLVVNACLATRLAGAFMLAGTLLDWMVFPDKAGDFLLIRAISAVPLLLLCPLLRLPWRHRATAQGLAQLIPLIPTISICWMIVVTGGGNSVYYAGLNLVLLGLSVLLRWSFLNSVVMVVTCFASYAVSVWVASTRADFGTLFNNAYFLFVTGVFVLAGSLYYERLRFREFRLRREVESAREMVEAQNRQLSELDEAKTRFFANISHELRTPLTVMLGITDRMRGLPMLQNDPRGGEMVDLLGQNGLRLLKLIDDLLDLVRFDTGHADLMPQPTELRSHLDGLLKSVRHLAEQDKVALIWDGPEEGRWMIDRDKFDKIVLNLVVNAIKFTPSSGTIEVKTVVKDGRLKLSVADTGVGIAPDVLPRIFERFWQVDGSSTRKFQGAGIGLSLVRSLCDVQGGEIRAESELGRGTTFFVDLPVVAATATEDAAGDDPSDSIIADLHRRAAMAMPSKIQDTRPAYAGLGKPTPIGRVGGARPLVLIADDEPDIRRFLRMQMEDVEVIEASDGAQALQLVKQHQPQLVLLDHMMPEMDGVEVCRAVRENHATRGVAVIILTARADEQTKLAALEAGANDFLTKPFSTAELSLRLENQLAMARIRRELQELNRELQAALEQIKENEVLLVRNEKLSALGRMSAGLIHEINNPLNYSRAGLHALETFSKLLPEDERPDYADIVGDIREGVERVSQIIADLRQFTRDEPAEAVGNADLVEIIERSRRMAGHQINGSIAFELTAPSQAPIKGNSNQLVQVFVNLMQNSVDAIHERQKSEPGLEGRIRVGLEPSGQGWLVTVGDNGVGIPPESVQKIFDPFYTSKDVGKGMGLGLSITHQILQRHQARVEVESRPFDSTVFRLYFPSVLKEEEASLPALSA